MKLISLQYLKHQGLLDIYIEKSDCLGEHLQKDKLSGDESFLETEILSKQTEADKKPQRHVQMCSSSEKLVKLDCENTSHQLACALLSENRIVRTSHRERSLFRQKLGGH